MNRLIRKSVTPLSALVVAVVFLMGVAIIAISNVSHATDNSTSQTGRLITIHDRGMEKVILSQSLNIGDAIKEAGISLDKNDTVEPKLDTKLVASDYQVNIYRARPVMIIDGNIRQRVMTPYQTAEQIAISAGITLYPEDKTQVGLSSDLVDGAGLTLTITRAIEFNFTLYGKTSTTRTQAKTVGEMLIEKGIKLSSIDKVLPASDTDLTSGMNIRLWREGKQTIAVDEAVDFAVEQIENANQSVGYSEINTAGIKGERSVTYEVMIQDGVEVGRTEIASIVTKQPTTQIVTIGVKGQYNTPTENENVTWDFLISQGFSRTQTAGIMGNLMQEHHFNTSDTSGGLGLVQWTGGRRSKLMNEYPDSYTNIYSQLNFLMEELNGGYSSVQSAIKNSSSLYDSVRIFQNSFERCGVCREEARINFAESILGSH